MASPSQQVTSVASGDVMRLSVKTPQQSRKKNTYQRKPSAQVILAHEMVAGIMRQAESVFSSDKRFADRYVGMARRIAMKYRLRLPSGIRRKYCKHCHAFLRPGANCRVRIGVKHVSYYCLECKKFMRFVHKSKSVKKNIP